MKKAIGYVRVSTTQQDLLRQQVLLKEWCAANDYVLVKILEDKLSGAKADRKGYLELLNTTKADADIVVVSELSRLSRQKEIMKTLTAINDLLENGLDVAFLDNGQIYKGGTELELIDIITIAVEANNAATERKKIVQRMLSGRKTKFLTYANMCIGKVPFGYERKPNPDYVRNVTPKTLLVRSEKAEVVKDIFKWIASGKKLREVVDILRAKGIKTNQNSEIYTNSLDTMIHNPIYKGEWKFSGQIIKGDAIVSEELWLKAQKALKEKRMYDVIQGVNYNPLKGIIKCPCGKGMYIVHMYKYYQYRCGLKKDKYDVQVCHNGGIDRDIVVPCCWWAIKTQVNTRDYAKQTNEELIKIDANLKDIDIIIDGLKQSLEHNEEEKNVLANNMTKITNTDLLLKFQDRYNILEDKGKSIVNDIEHYKQDKIDLVSTRNELLKNTQIIDNISIEEKSVIFHKYLSKVVFYGEPKKHRGFIVVTFKNGAEIVFLSIARKEKVCSVLPTFGFDVEQRKVYLDNIVADKDNPYNLNTKRSFYDCWEVERVFPDIIEQNNIFGLKPEFD